MADNNAGSVGVIGGGISGLATAFHLDELGMTSTVYESSSQIGGVIKSVRKDGWLVELGPNTLMARTEQLWNLIQRLGLKSEVLHTGKVAKKRFIVSDGIPVPLPTSLLQFISTDLVSARAKLRLLKEPFIPPAEPERRESVADFFERRFGKEITDYTVDPFVAGIFAGKAELLSMEHTFSSLHAMEREYGSLLRAAIRIPKKKKDKKIRKGLISFQNGIQQLPETLGSYLGPAIQYDSRVTRVTRETKEWQLQVGGRGEPTRHKALVCTAPPHRLAGIRFNIDRSELLETLSGMRYAPIATVALGFGREQVAHALDGFGMLVPEIEGYHILGCLFSSTLFEGRAPEGFSLLTCFAGGERAPGLVDLPADKIRSLVLEDLRDLLDVSGEPVFEHIHKWQKAIPQYRMNHGSMLEALRSLEDSNPGLFFAGNFREEVSVPGCIEKAYETAERVASFLQS